jgi:hypothetical protein
MELLKPCLRRLCHSAKERFAVRVDTSSYDNNVSALRKIYRYCLGTGLGKVSHPRLLKHVLKPRFSALRKRLLLNQSV